jgi:hypothetical protein
LGIRLASLGDMATWRHGGMSLHDADVDVPTNDRNRLERLCRHVVRPPIPLARASEESPSRDGPKPISPRRLLWAELLQRAFELDALSCPKCGGRMRVLSAITDPIVAARILRCLALPSRAPPLATSPDGAGHSDSAGGVSSVEIPEFDFDQSQPVDDCESSA